MNRSIAQGLVAFLALTLGSGSVFAQCQDGLTHLSRSVSGLKPKANPQPWEARRSETFDVVFNNGVELKNLPKEKAVLVAFPGGATSRIEGVSAYIDHDHSPLGEDSLVEIAGEESSEQLPGRGRDYIAMQRDSDARSEYIYLQSSCDPQDAHEQPVVYLQPERVEAWPDGRIKMLVGEGKTIWGGWATLSQGADGAYHARAKNGGDIRVEPLLPAAWVLDPSPALSRRAWPVAAPATQSSSSQGALSRLRRFLGREVHF